MLVKLVASTDTDRIPVDVGGATINVNATTVVVTKNHPATDTLQAPAAVGNAAAQLLAADAARMVWRVRNAGPGLLAIGDATVTVNNAVILLSPGDIWTEDDVPQLQRYAVSDSNATAALEVLK